MRRLAVLVVALAVLTGCGRSALDVAILSANAAKVAHDGAVERLDARRKVLKASLLEDGTLTPEERAERYLAHRAAERPMLDASEAFRALWPSLAAAIGVAVMAAESGQPPPLADVLRLLGEAWASLQALGVPPPQRLVGAP